MGRHDGLVEELRRNDIFGLVIEDLLDGKILVVGTESIEVVRFIEIIL